MQGLVIGVGVALVVVGVLFAVIGKGADAGSGGWHNVGVKGPAWLVLVAMGVGLIVFGATRDWSSQGVFATTTSASSATTSSRSTTSTTTATTSTEESTTTGSSGCVITIANRFASIREEPDPFGQEIVRLPPGSYSVEDITTETFAGVSARWFLITVDARSGWIEDNTAMIESKSAGCP